MSSKKLLIFFPTLNEANNVIPLITELNKLYPNSDFLVIDDDSTDDTVLNLNNLKLSNLEIVIRKNIFGIGSAHKYALKYALQKEYDTLVTMDSDGTHRPIDVAKILNNINEFDIVVGSRFMSDSAILNWSKTRMFLTASGHHVTKYGLGIPYDCSSGMRGYNLTTRSFIEILGTNGNGFDFFYQSLFNFYKINPGRIAEVPITLLPRFSGDSKLSFKLASMSILKLVLEIIKFKSANFIRKK
jgi:dolichol-phosphate mannosyltransferase